MIKADIGGDISVKKGKKVKAKAKAKAKTVKAK